MCGMRVRLLGPLDVVGDAGAVRLPGAVPRAIVARLLLARGDVVRRDDLVDDIWEQRSAKDPVNALQVQLAKLRAVFAAGGEHDRLLFRHGGYQLVLRAQDSLDVTQFESGIREGRGRLDAGDHRNAELMLRQALELWRGPAFADTAGAVFDRERSRLDGLRLAALEDAALAALELGRADSAVQELQTLVSQTPLRERSRARLMLALCRGGRHAEALEVFESGRRLLRDELGADPSPDLRDLHAAILRQDEALYALRTADADVHSPLTRSPLTTVAETAEAEGAAGTAGGNVRRPLGSFVGRGADLDALRTLLDRERLVSVLGPGGVGKTRLALEACALLRPEYEAVWWVDLAAVGEDAVPAAIAAALGLSDAAARPGQRSHGHLFRLTSFLTGKRVLLALDNCEHLLDGVAAVVATLLTTCPALTVLATTRSPLGMVGEALYPLDPLPDKEAAELFSARAALVDPSFTADEGTMRDIRGLCRRLDGLPLAVELAAAHVRLLSVREIEARLDDRFALLAKGDRAAPPRHRTLRAVLDWSYALLDEPEQRLLMHLALNVSGSTLADAEGVAASPSVGAAHAPLTAVGRLVDASLLVPVRTPFGRRVRMLETVREYALARLRESGFAPQAERRFMDWAADYARAACAGIASGDQGWWAGRITEEFANLRAASELMALRSRADDALLTEARLGYYWFVSGREEEGIEPLRRSLQAYDAQSRPATTAPRDQDEEWALFSAVAWLVWLCHETGRHAEAAEFIRRHEEVWRAATSPMLKALGRCYVPLYGMMSGRGDLSQQFAAADQALKGTDLHWERVVLQTKWSTHCLHQGDGEAARHHASAAIEASQDAGDGFARAWSLTLAGDADESCGLHRSARRHWTEAASTFHSIGARTRWAYVLLRIAYLDVAEDHRTAAEERLADVQRLADDLSSDDLRAGAANLRAVLALRESRRDDARTGFRRVWKTTTAPLDRRAVAALGLAALASTAETQRHLDQAQDLQTRLLEPLGRRAVATLLQRPHDQLATALLDGPSVWAAFC
ncbi:Predicted ATPase [Streptacidiphilus jiangxiensis]|uniref:Predicted ATPase n=2 Tax=Streptacidiphilus jiangxiensis TaxID=235985 RepID=A0A1H7WE46_STRJI|nr:Predicted ATPase [Streptacidiphilus jiangxiensis]